MRKNKIIGLYIKIGKSEELMIKALRNVYYINISKFIRGSIEDLYMKLEKEKNEKI